MRNPFVLRKPFTATLFLPITLTALSLATNGKNATWSDNSRHKSGFVTANGVRLNYLDWGGSGSALILIHGIFDNPHIFDDLAPAFTDRFHVVAYARRGHGLSEAKEAYDTATLTEDLRGLMDALGIPKAHLVGWSMGGNEITAMAGTHPERVDRIVYLDGAYDFGDPVFVAAFKMAPPLQPPSSARASLDAWLAYQKNVMFPGVTDASRLEAYNRELVVIQPDGTVQDRMGESTAQALLKTLLTDRRDYTKVRCPTFAFFAATMPDVGKRDSPMTVGALAWDKKYMAPFRAASIERVKRELPGVEVVNVPGAHVDFVLTNREQVVTVMRRFLSGSPPPG